MQERLVQVRELAAREPEQEQRQVRQVRQPQVRVLQQARPLVWERGGLRWQLLPHRSWRPQY